MSSQSQNTQTARDAIGQYLQNNPGWTEVTPIVRSTGYTRGHILQTATDMANDSSSSVEKRKNFSKPVVAYIFNGNWEFPGADPQEYIQLIRMYSNSPPATLTSMSLSDLQSELRNVADGTTVPEFKVEFRIP